MPSGIGPAPPAATPRTLWIELTSKCPLDCIFCSRKSRRGAGEHLAFPIYEKLVASVRDPCRFVLNYSGESTVYPGLVPAIQLARTHGAFVELVSVLSPASDLQLRDLARSGLNRLTVSVHAAAGEAFHEIYRYGEFDGLRARLELFVALCRELENPPIVDLAFVALDRNLDQLPGVAALASRLGLGEITVFPVLRRDEIPATFPVELDPRGSRRPTFDARVREAVAVARAAHPNIQFTIGDPPPDPGRCLGEVPVPWPAPLPLGAQIHSCEQNPWDTAHVLANGDVVACEVLDRIALGNLHRQSLDEIWHGEPYRDFRRRYHAGKVAGCRTCPWKQAYLPGPPAAEILAERGGSAQLAHGWHEPAGEPHIWSTRHAAAVLAPRPGAGVLHVSGSLPPGLPGRPNDLAIVCNGGEVGRIVNPWNEAMPFGVDFPIVPNGTGPWYVEFRTAHQFRPCERDAGPDRRDLGFALGLLAAKRAPAAVVPRGRVRAIRRLRIQLQIIDGIAKRFGPLLEPARAAPLRPGISVIVPECANAADLACCLESVAAAASSVAEPVQTIVVVNGSPATDYRKLVTSHPGVEWRFHRDRLGFGGAIRAGLWAARFDWVFLLNSDAELAPHALRESAACRDPLIFAVGSQIQLKDRTRFRDETNWCTMFLEDGLAAIHDWIPHGAGVRESFYAGGGASLFQTRLLRRFLAPSAYHPFYWEDVEWGWRARKLGYRVVMCPASVAEHRRRGTIGRMYPPEYVEDVIARNRLLFQLRNLTTGASPERVLNELAVAPAGIADSLLRPAAAGRIAPGRAWNWLAPRTDAEVLSGWTRQPPPG